MTTQQTTVAGLNTQLQDQQKSCDSSKAELQKQLAELKRRQDEQQAKLTEQQAITSRLETELQEQNKVNDGIKQSVATLETELRAQQLDHQTRLKEHKDTETRLETMIQEQGESMKQALAKLRTDLNKKQGEAFFDKVVRVIGEEVTEERITWCLAGILVVLPSVVIAVANSLT